MAFGMDDKFSAPDRVRGALQAAGLHPEIKQFAESTRTAQDAANAIGTTVGQIVKSLLFLSGDRPVMALVSGANQLDTAKLSRLTGREIRKADAATVRQATGYAIGGVPPVGFPNMIETYLDADLLQYEELWAAAGTPNHVFRTTPTELVTLTQARRADLKRA
jgi:prolyl-tRNA editing enzyme YbaK/EbsC (Cys-tRNA(Pro) deacylase)